jgi:hypothetical protein
MMKTLFLFLLLAPALLTAQTQTAPDPLDPIANYIALSKQHTLLEAEKDRLAAELVAMQQSLDRVMAANSQIAAQKEALTAQVTALQNLLTEWQAYATALKQQAATPVRPVYHYTVTSPDPAPAPAPARVRTYHQGIPGTWISDDGQHTLMQGVPGTAISISR